jgi:hypothetical protein
MPQAHARDTNQLAAEIVKLATGQPLEPEPDAGKNPHAVALGRLGRIEGRDRPQDETVQSSPFRDCAQSRSGPVEKASRVIKFASLPDSTKLRLVFPLCGHDG